ncbi:unnamed protein product [Parascedosporium putredinis]|uniref:Uncharacterized protein n=1 Tax=Parascedosporium putredinis TaxID=1442378 RepID=A0A9P1GZB1_9PEZI|nr:unnamed protein product [Parascedosporium putredinis]CAI7991633.1 unnamed protein product [Parascedosporium putredinis]
MAYPVDVAALVAEMSDTLSTIRSTIDTLSSADHHSRLDQLEHQRDSTLAALRANFEREGDDLAAKRRKERDDLAERRRREDEEILARRKREDEDLAMRDEQEDGERQNRHVTETDDVEDEMDGLMEVIELEAQAVLDEGRDKLARLEDRRRELNRLIDEQMKVPLPSIPTRRRSRTNRTMDSAITSKPPPEPTQATLGEPLNNHVKATKEPAPASAPVLAPVPELPRGADLADAATAAAAERDLPQLAEEEDVSDAFMPRDVTHGAREVVLEPKEFEVDAAAAQQRMRRARIGRTSVSRALPEEVPQVVAPVEPVVAKEEPVYHEELTPESPVRSLPTVQEPTLEERVIEERFVEPVVSNPADEFSPPQSPASESNVVEQTIDMGRDTIALALTSDERVETPRAEVYASFVDRSVHESMSNYAAADSGSPVRNYQEGYRSYYEEESYERSPGSPVVLVHDAPYDEPVVEESQVISEEPHRVMEDEYDSRPSSRTSSIVESAPPVLEIRSVVTEVPVEVVIEEVASVEEPITQHTTEAQVVQEREAPTSPAFDLDRQSPAEQYAATFGHPEPEIYSEDELQDAFDHDEDAPVVMQTRQMSPTYVEQAEILMAQAAVMYGQREVEVAYEDQVYVEVPQTVQHVMEAKVSPMEDETLIQREDSRYLEPRMDEDVAIDSFSSAETEAEEEYAHVQNVQDVTHEQKPTAPVMSDEDSAAEIDNAPTPSQKLQVDLADYKMEFDAAVENVQLPNGTWSVGVHDDAVYQSMVDEYLAPKSYPHNPTPSELPEDVDAPEDLREEMYYTEKTYEVPYLNSPRAESELTYGDDEDEADNFGLDYARRPDALVEDVVIEQFATYADTYEVPQLDPIRDVPSFHSPVYERGMGSGDYEDRVFEDQVYEDQVYEDQVYEDRVYGDRTYEDESEVENFRDQGARSDDDDEEDDEFELERFRSGEQRHFEQDSEPEHFRGQDEDDATNSDYASEPEIPRAAAAAAAAAAVEEEEDYDDDDSEGSDQEAFEPEAEPVQEVPVLAGAAGQATPEPEARAAEEEPVQESSADAEIDQVAQVAQGTAAEDVVPAQEVAAVEDSDARELAQVSPVADISDISDASDASDREAVEEAAHVDWAREALPDMAQRSDGAGGTPDAALARFRETFARFRKAVAPSIERRFSQLEEPAPKVLEELRLASPALNGVMREQQSVAAQLDNGAWVTDPTEEEYRSASAAVAAGSVETREVLESPAEVEERGLMVEETPGLEMSDSFTETPLTEQVVTPEEIGHAAQPAVSSLYESMMRDGDSTEAEVSVDKVPSLPVVIDTLPLETSWAPNDQSVHDHEHTYTTTYSYENHVIYEEDHPAAAFEARMAQYSDTLTAGDTTTDKELFESDDESDYQSQASVYADGIQDVHHQRGSVSPEIVPAASLIDAELMSYEEMRPVDYTSENSPSATSDPEDNSDVSPLSKSGGCSSIPQARGLAFSRHNPDRPVTPPGQTATESYGTMADSPQVPWDASGQIDSTPMSLVSQSTISSSSESPVHASLPIDNHEPVIRDSWPAPIGHHPFEGHDMHVPSPLQYHDDPKAVSEENLPTPIATQMPHNALARNSFAAHSATSSPARSRPSSGIFSFPLKRAATVGAAAAKSPGYDVPGERRRGGFLNEHEDEIDERSALLSGVDDN